MTATATLRLSRTWLEGQLACQRRKAWRHRSRAETFVALGNRRWAETEAGLAAQAEAEAARLARLLAETEG